MILKVVENYLNGDPATAYIFIRKAMMILVKNPLRLYNESAYELFEPKNKNTTNLFRVVTVDDNKAHGRERVFHAPKNLRSKVSTCRYSIAGYPSLYLGTNLDLCCEEICINHNHKLALASRFELCPKYKNEMIHVIELSIKPQDF